MKQIAQTILCILALCALTQTAQAQDLKKAIRAHYAEAKAYVDQVKKMEAEGFSYPVPQYFSAHVKQNLPATGFHQEEVLMYYQERRDSDEQIYPSLYLDFAVKKYNFAAREYYEEYLYDEQGRIQFIYATSPILDFENDYEFRLVEEELESMGIPVIRLESDYTDQDVEQLRIRSEAFVETIKLKKGPLKASRG